MPASGTNGVPATNSSESTMAPSTMVVPRLGCAMRSTATMPNTTTTGRNVSRESSIHAARRARRSATNNSTVSLASSEGWREKGP